MRLEHLPGGDLIARGLEDLSCGRETAEALLVSIGAARLREAGLPVGRILPDAEHRLDPYAQALAKIERGHAIDTLECLLPSAVLSP